MAARSRDSGAVSSRVAGGPVEVAPPGFVPAFEQEWILAEALAGVELGAWDRRMVVWLAGGTPDGVDHRVAGRPGSWDGAGAVSETGGRMGVSHPLCDIFGSIFRS